MSGEFPDIFVGIGINEGQFLFEFTKARVLDHLSAVAAGIKNKPLQS